MRKMRVPLDTATEDMQPVYKSPRYFSVNPETSFWTENSELFFIINYLMAVIRQVPLRRRGAGPLEQHTKTTLFASATGIGTASRPRIGSIRPGNR
jgi:hypothetical protein